MVKLRFVTATVLCLVLSALSFAPGAQAFTSTAIDTHVQAQMASARIPGMAVAIVKDGQIVHTQAYGAAGADGRPVTPQTPFILGSTSKSFTAMAIWQLVEAGKLDLDAPVKQYLPWFELADQDAAARLTARHLLTHTSGIGTSTSFQLDINPQSTKEDVVRQLKSVALTAPLGTTFQYSNVNYTMLGLLIETLAGQPYERYMQERIFAPLGMTHTYATQEPALQDGMSSGHQFFFGYPLARTVPYNPSETPAGFIIASAEDMGRYLLAVMNGGKIGAASVLSAGSVTAMQSPAVPMGPGSQYAMGWERSSMQGVPVIAHRGDVANFQSYMVIKEDKGWGVVLLANSSNPLAPDFQRIVEGVVSLLEGMEPPAAPGLSTGLQMLLLGILLALVVVRQVWSLWRVKSHQRLPYLRITGNLVLGLVLLGGVPALTGFPWPTLLVFMPDLAYSVAAIGTLSLAVGAAQLIHGFRSARRTAAG